MDKIRVLYYGHSCFALRTGGGSVVLDPYEDGSVPGLRLPRGLTADVVYCSHDHSDHNAAQLVGLTGRPAPFPVSYLTVPHDDADGRKRGLTKLTFISACGIHKRLRHHGGPSRRYREAAHGGGVPEAADGGRRNASVRRILYDRFTAGAGADSKFAEALSENFDALQGWQQRIRGSLRYLGNSANNSWGEAPAEFVSGHYGGKSSAG